MSSIELTKVAEDAVMVALVADGYERALEMKLSNLTPEQVKDEATLLELVATMVREQGGGTLAGVLKAAGA